MSLLTTDHVLELSLDKYSHAVHFVVLDTPLILKSKEIFLLCEKESLSLSL